jgi:hypothetical protein
MSKSAALLRRLDKSLLSSGPMMYTLKMDKVEVKQILEVCRKLDPDISLRTVYRVDNREVVPPHIKEFIIENTEKEFAYLTVSPQDTYYHDVKGNVWLSASDAVKLIERINSF